MVARVASRVRIHPRATAETLALARILVGLLWLLRLIPDPVHRLGYLPAELWFARGVMEVVPEPVMLGLLDPVALTTLRFVAMALAVLVVLGIRPHRFGLLALTLTMILYLGIAKGFGGHVNHRELVLLYVTGLLVFLPCFDGLAVHPDRRPPGGDERYRASMIAICLVIVTSYMFVGVGRLAMGFPQVFDPDVMRGWMVHRSLRANPLGPEFGAALLDSPLSRYALPAMLPVSTILEILAPMALFLRRRPRLVLVACLASMHVGIALLMNIVFVESLFLLLLLLDYTPWYERMLSARRGAE